MKPHLLLFLGILTAAITACSGQRSPKDLSEVYTIPVRNATPPDTVTALGKHIMLVFQDRQNNHWFGSWGEGLYRYDGKTLLHYTTEHGLCNNRIEEIREDASGNLYFNTPAGISKFDGQFFVTLKKSMDTLGDWQLNPDDIWFKCLDHSGHVYRYDGTFLHTLKLPASPSENAFRAMSPNGTLDPYAVYCVYTDTKGNIWFGTAVLGACRYDGKSFGWISETDVTEIHNGPSNGVRSIMEDQDGYFWFNSAYRYKIYPATGVPYSPDTSRFSYLREKGIGSLDGRKDGDLVEYLSIAKDNNKHLWIATYTSGVWRYDGEKITPYRVKDASGDITLFSVYKDRQGKLWLGTHESGAYTFNGETFEQFVPGGE